MSPPPAPPENPEDSVRLRGERARGERGRPPCTARRGAAVCGICLPSNWSSSFPAPRQSLWPMGLTQPTASGEGM